MKTEAVRLDALIARLRAAATEDALSIGDVWTLLTEAAGALEKIFLALDCETECPCCLKRFANDVCAMCHDGVGNGGEATKAAILSHAEHVCEWGEEDGGLSEYWETQCGNAFVLIDGSPKQNGMNFCPYCGGKLIERSNVKVNSAAEGSPATERSEKGPWTVSEDGRRIESDDFTHDVILRVTGDFYSDNQRKAYAENLAAKLNVPNANVTGLAPAQEGK